MRLRNKTIVHRTFSNGGRGLITVVITKCDGSTQNASYTDSAVSGLVTSSSVEEMEDELGKGSSHPVKHRKFTVDIGEDLSYTGPNVGPGGGYTTYGDLTFVPGYNKSLFDPRAGWTNGVLPHGWAIDASVDESPLKEGVIEAARGLKADVLLNLVEAWQIWPSIQSLAMSLPNMARHWKDLRKVIRTASGGFLAWKFGVSPILSDIMSITRYLPVIESDLKRHKDGDKTRYSRVGILGASSALESIPGDIAIGITRESKMQQEPQVRYVLVVKPTIKYETNIFKYLSFAMSRFATSPASLAWELVPFSFVVDWFVDLRGALRAIDAAVGSEPYQTVSFTRSFSYHLETSIHWSQYSNCPSGQMLFKKRAGTAQYKYYERSMVSSAPSWPTWRPRFGKNQAGISAALISQQLSKL